jgi:hypothetical protein
LKTVVAILAFIIGLAALAATAQVVTIPEGTAVRVRLAETIGSASAHVGDAVRMEILDDVQVGGSTVIRRGSLAIGEVTVAEEKKRMGRAGKVAFALDYLVAADGSKIAASATRKQKGSNSAGTITTGIVVSAVVFAPVAPLFLLKHGKDTAVPFGTIFPAFTTADAPVNVGPVAVAVALPVAVAPRAVPQSPTSTEHAVEGYTLSGPGAGSTTYTVPDSEMSVGDAARAARAKKAAKEAGKQ